MSSFRDELTAMPAARLTFLCLLWGGDETPASVPADMREKFESHVAHHNALASRWYEDACRYYGSETGEFEGVPRDRQAEAILECRRDVADHVSKCQFELDLKRIDIRERAAKAKAASRFKEFG